MDLLDLTPIVQPLTPRNFPALIEAPDLHQYQPHDLIDLMPLLSTTAKQHWGMQIQDLPACHPNGPWIGGGSVRRFLTHDYRKHHTALQYDIDYFCQSREQETDLLRELFLYSRQLPVKTETAYTFSFESHRPALGSLDVQVISITRYPTVAHLISQFDFTLCQTVYDGQHLYITRQAYEDISTGTLRLTGTLTRPRSTWMRIIKYAQQGFTPVPGLYDSLLPSCYGDDLVSSFGV